MEQKFCALKERLAEIHDLNTILSILEWDQEVMMPPRGSAVRAEQLATLSRIAHEKFISDEVGGLLRDLGAYEESLPYDSDEASLIRLSRHDYEKARRVPPALAMEMTRAAAQAYEVWVVARKQSDYGLFRPYLQEHLDLKRRYIACFDPQVTDYDILLDDFERGMKTCEVTAIFEALKADLVPLIEAIAARGAAVSDACLHGHFPIEQQRTFCLAVLERLGFTPDSWRLDPTVHPFSSGAGINDRRITTRYHEDYVGAALFGCIHECGHGLYDHGIDLALERTPLCQGASSALHESQSRMWENLVGRSRPFWRFFYARLQDTFSESYAGMDMEEFYRAINKVQPSLIRVEADEATYSLHIIVRFELEQELIGGTLALADLPEAWNARMKAYLGIDVPDDAHGVLQDVHWSLGYMGYFPTYALGNIIACQIWERIIADIPDLQEQFARGEFAPLREWLRQHLHRHGAKFTPMEILRRVVGGPIDVKPYIRYLRGKFGEIYGLSD